MFLLDSLSCLFSKDLEDGIDSSCHCCKWLSQFYYTPSTHILQFSRSELKNELHRTKVMGSADLPPSGCCLQHLVATCFLSYRSIFHLKYTSLYRTCFYYHSIFIIIASDSFCIHLISSIVIIWDPPYISFDDFFILNFWIYSH